MKYENKKREVDEGRRKGVVRERMRGIKPSLLKKCPTCVHTCIPESWDNCEICYGNELRGNRKPYEGHLRLWKME